MSILMERPGGAIVRKRFEPLRAHVRRIHAEEPWRWLAAGWEDMKAVPHISLAYGAVFFLASVSLVGTLFLLKLAALVPVMAAGFLIVGPMLAVGLYEASRRLETGLPVRLGDVLFVSTGNPSQLAFIGIMLMGIMLVWLQAAFWLFAFFYGMAGLPALADMVPDLLLTPRGLGLLIAGTAVGAVLAFTAFAISVVSVPLLLARDVDAVTAVLISIEAVRRNFWPMLLWGWIVAMLTAFGIATFFLGLIIVFPLLGHATWHAHRALAVEG